MKTFTDQQKWHAYCRGKKWSGPFIIDDPINTYTYYTGPMGPIAIWNDKKNIGYVFDSTPDKA